MIFPAEILLLLEVSQVVLEILQLAAAAMILQIAIEFKVNTQEIQNW